MCSLLLKRSCKIKDNFIIFCKHFKFASLHLNSLRLKMFFF